MLRPAVFVPEAKRLNVLLREFRASRNHMAIVIDEYGGVAGLVTIEDVLEQIVGDIEDEYDFDEASDNILPEPGGRHRVKAITQIADFNAVFGTRFPDEGADTIGGFLIKHLGRLPKRGESVGSTACASRCCAPTAGAFTRFWSTSRRRDRLRRARRAFRVRALRLEPLAFLTLALLIHFWIDAPPRRCVARLLPLASASSARACPGLREPSRSAACRPCSRLATALFCAFLALFPAAAGWLGAYSGARGHPRLPAHPGGLGAVRMALTWIFTGFPWLAIGYTAAGWPLQGYAPLGGVYAVSFVTVAIAGMLWLLAQHRPMFLIAIVAVVGVGEALRRVEWSQKAGEPVSVALLQGNIEQEMKFRPERAATILLTYARLAEDTRAPRHLPGNGPAGFLGSHRSRVSRASGVGGQAQSGRSTGGCAVPNGRGVLQQRGVARHFTAPAVSQGAPGAVRRVRAARIRLDFARAVHSAVGFQPHPNARRSKSPGSAWR